MTNNKLFIISFLATLLIISSAPTYIYRNNIQNSEPWNPENSEPVTLNRFSSLKS